MAHDTDPRRRAPAVDETPPHRPPGAPSNPALEIGDQGVGWLTFDDPERKLNVLTVPVMRRLAVKPGITGLWQILGRKDLPMHENLQYDFYYIRNRSLALDASILLRTVGAVWSRRGAF